MTSLTEIRIAGRFRLEEILDKGNFSTVYFGRHVHSNKLLALKLEDRKSKFPQVSFESQVLRRLKGTIGIPELIWSGSNGDFNCLVLQKLGSNLQTLCKNCGGSFSLKTSMMILDQLLGIFELIHSKWVIHRDIKPENFCIGEDSWNKNKFFMIDFGLSKIFYSEKEGHIEKRGGKSLLGKDLYASVNNHKGEELSRRDDLESLIYMILHLMTGSLPWQSIAGKKKTNKVMKNQQLKEIKKQFLMSKFWKLARVKLRSSDSVLSDSQDVLVKIPEGIKEIYEDVINLGFEQEPRYLKYRKIVKCIMMENKLENDYLFDWVFIPLKKNINENLDEIDKLIEGDYEFSEEEDDIIDDLIGFYESDKNVIDFNLREIRKQNKKYDVTGDVDETLEDSEILKQIEEKKNNLEVGKKKKKKKDKDCNLI